MQVMVRHGKNNKGQRNRTLTTARLGDNHLVFGVSRCNLQADKWNKHYGAVLAEERMRTVICDLATGDCNYLTETMDGSLNLLHGKEVLAGVIDIEKTVELVKWFRDDLK